MIGVDMNWNTKSDKAVDDIFKRYTADIREYLMKNAMKAWDKERDEYRKQKELEKQQAKERAQGQQISMFDNIEREK